MLLFTANAIALALNFLHLQAKEYYYDVVAGMLRKESKSPMTQSRHIVEAYMHEDFEAMHYSNDIAVAKVNEPFILSTHTMFACLPEASALASSLPKPGEACFAAGWGNTMENRDPSEGLREVEIPVMENCKREYNDISKQICGGRPEGGADACQGNNLIPAKVADKL